jgi:hypothetical protein
VSDYDNLPPSKPVPRRANKDPVFCVGWRAEVNWPAKPGQPSTAVPLFDGDGKPLSNDLSDGDEVEILSWRPKSRQGSLYQVRRLADDSEWWIAAIHLRRQGQTATPEPR